MLTPGRLSRLHEFTPVPSHSTIFVHAGASHPGVSSPPLLYRDENFTPGRNLATASCKRDRRHSLHSFSRPLPPSFSRFISYFATHEGKTHQKTRLLFRLRYLSLKFRLKILLTDRSFGYLFPAVSFGCWRVQEAWYMCLGWRCLQSSGC